MNHFDTEWGHVVELSNVGISPVGVTEVEPDVLAAIGGSHARQIGPRPGS